MNKFTLFFLSLFVGLTSCREDKPQPDPKGYTISFSGMRESIGTSQAPLNDAKASSSDLCAVQVWKLTTGEPTPYAYGIFNDESLMNITLPSGSTYKVEMSVIPNGANLISKNTISQLYRAPLTTQNGASAVDNQFTVTNECNLQYINKGYTARDQSSSYAFFDRPDISRFYGVVESFTPTGDAGVSIDLKWVVFGLTVIPEGLTEGTLKLELEGAADVIIPYTTPLTVDKKIFTFSHTGTEDWCSDTYSEAIPMKITWIKTDNSTVVYLEKTDLSPIVFKRKVETILRIQLAATPTPVPAGSITTTKETATLQAPTSEIVIKKQP